MQFLSVGKDLGVICLIDELDISCVNIAMEEDVSEERNDEKIETESDQRNLILSDIAQDNRKNLNNFCSQQGNIGFSCDKCDAIYRHRVSLYLHIKLVHERVKYDRNLCDYRATIQCNLKTHIK